MKEIKTTYIITKCKHTLFVGNETILCSVYFENYNS